MAGCLVALADTNSSTGLSANPFAQSLGPYPTGRNRGVDDRNICAVIGLQGQRMVIGADVWGARPGRSEAAESLRNDCD